MKTILIINGPNINRLGKRETKYYGKLSLNKIINLIKLNIRNKINLKFIQSNDEAHLIRSIPLKRSKDLIGIVINPAAYSYYSIALLDALIASRIKYIEVHISNIYSRDKFRTKSIFSCYSNGVIVGLGYYGYIYAIKYLIKLND